MNNFVYYNPTALHFGELDFKQLESRLIGYKKILVHYGSDRIKRSGLLDKVKNSILSSGAEMFECGGVLPNSPVLTIREGVEISKKNDIDLVLAIGGGSVIDSAKAICIGACSDKDIWEIFEKGHSINQVLPLGVILTVAATGSEASNASVIANLETEEKRVYENDMIYPKFSFLDPEMTITLPREETFAGIVDMLSHVMERYFTNTKNNDLTDALSEATMRTIIKNALILKEDISNKNARAEVMLCGTIAHCGILGIGREEDWASHRIGHEITAHFDTPHGDTLAIVLPVWMEYVFKNHLDIFSKFARNVFAIKEDDDYTSATKGIKKFKEFLKFIDKNIDTSKFEISDSIIEEMTMKSIFYDENNTLGNLEKLRKKDIINIYNMIFHS